jgi:membrane-associated protease RseP (regulator of RpoE activity)
MQEGFAWKRLLVLAAGNLFAVVQTLIAALRSFMGRARLAPMLGGRTMFMTVAPLTQMCAPSCALAPGSPAAQPLPATQTPGDHHHA